MAPSPPPRQATRHAHGGNDTEALAARATAGDMEALGALYDAWFDRMYRYAVVRMSGNTSLAEDAVQETWLRIARSVRRYRADNWGGWVFTILLNVIKTVLAREGVEREVLTSEVFSTDWSPLRKPSAEDECLSGVLPDDLAQAINQLPKDQRTCIVLRVIADLQPGEVAQAMGRSIGAVRSLQHRALMSLRATLGLTRPGNHARYRRRQAPAEGIRC